jgi:hypothetical protein
MNGSARTARVEVWVAERRTGQSFRPSGFTPAFGRAVGVFDPGCLLAWLKPCPFEEMVGCSGDGRGVEMGGSGRANVRCPPYPTMKPSAKMGHPVWWPKDGRKQVPRVARNDSQKGKCKGGRATRAMPTHDMKPS